MVVDDAGTVVLAAHAKINLFLSVGDRRPDGYHDVTTVVQALGLADEVVVVAGGSGIRVTCEPDVGVPADSNLAYLAAAAWARASGGPVDTDIRVRKRIPAGGGLGGGSSDAAAVLAALSGFDPEAGGAPSEMLMTTAAGLGADVPLFLTGGTQLLAGRGDTPVEALPTPDLHVVLVNCGIPVDTCAAYARFDRILMPPRRRPEAMLAALRARDTEAIARELHDNMTDASVSLVPEIAGTLRFLRGFPGVLGAEMAGSGSTVFGVCGDAASAADCAGAAAERGWWSCATTSVRHGVGRMVASTDEGAQRT